MKALRGMHVVITRPIHQATVLSDLISSHQGQPVLFPTLEIVPAASAEIIAAIAQLKEIDCFIFTSRNAVLPVVNLLPVHLAHVPIAAIGPSTARALQDNDRRVSMLPEKTFDSEHLLVLSTFEDVAGKRIVIFSGEGGRDYLVKELKRRGAEVHKIAVYRRQRPEVTQSAIETITNLHQAIVVFTSFESLQNFLFLLKEYSKEAWIYRQPLLVISERLRQRALELGFLPKLITVASQASDEALIKSLLTIKIPPPQTRA